MVSFVKRLVRHKPLTGKSALDVGCGSGVHARFLADEGACVLAFDGSPSAIEHARVLHGHPDTEYQVAYLADFDTASRHFSLVLDRLSSTYAPIDTVVEFYQGLKSNLAPDARLVWQGFDLENSRRDLGVYDDALRQWNRFSSGVFPSKNRISFFSDTDLEQVFAGYTFVSKGLISDLDLNSGYRHIYWNLEPSYGGVT